MNNNYFIPMILVMLIFIGVAFVAGMSITNNKDNSNQVTSQLTNKVKNMIDKTIDKFDNMIDNVIDKLVTKLPKQCKKIGKNFLEVFWNKIRNTFLNKIGA